MLASVPLMLEYEAVLTRPDQLVKAGITAKEANILLDTQAAVAEPITLWFHWRPQLQDPADEIVLETAVNGRADRMATFNLRHLGKATAAFGIQTARPGDIWRELQGAKYEKK